MKKGHYFPSSAGFKGSTGRVRQVKSYTQSVPRAIVKREGPMSDADARLLSRVPVQKANGGMIGALGSAVRGKIAGPGGVKAPIRPVSGPKMAPQTMDIKAPAPMLRSAPKPPPMGTAFARGGAVTIGDQGNAAVKRGNPPITETDKSYGGKGPLTQGYSKGGFNRKPKFGK